MTDFDYIEKCSSKLISFGRAVQPKYTFPWHLQKLMSILEAVERGDLTRVMITFPPRHGKSETSSVIFPAYFAGRNPGSEVMVVSGTQKLASRFGSKCRNIIKSDAYKLIFPEMELDQSSHAKADFSFKQGGSLLFSGIGGQITGRGANLFIIDDLIPGREEADSEAFREKARAWYDEECYNRLMSDAKCPHGRLVIIGTRWRDDDIHGWLLDPEEQHKVEDWTIFNFPAIAEEDEEFRKAGEALWPEVLSKDVLEGIKESKPRMFAGTYQQKPYIQTGNIVQRSWLNIEKIDDSLLIPPRILSLDTAFKTGTDNDFTAATVLQRTRNKIIILYAEKRKLTFPALIEWIEAFARIYGIQGIIVEDKASGQSAIQTLRTKTMLPVIAIKVKKGEDKEQRLHSITPFLESGGVIFHKWLPTVTQDQLIEELLKFPAGAHDDMVDSFVHGVRYLLTAGSALKRFGQRKTTDIPSIYGR
jgi:predicted phage terminase large subunit-like protein